jgi:hypothetical protein
VIVPSFWRKIAVSFCQIEFAQFLDRKWYDLSHGQDLGAEEKMILKAQRRITERSSVLLRPDHHDHPP